MSKRINYLITDTNITVNYDGQTHIVPRSDALAQKLIDAVRAQSMDEIPNLVSKAKRVEAFSKGTFVVRNGEILVNGVPAPSALGNKILKFADEGLPYEPLVKFAANLQKNPSFRAVNELFQFLEKNDHPITDNGCFIAYKRVKSDFMDIHSGTFDNSPGNVVEMPRNQVDEDATRTCSKGLHVANWDYAHNHFGSSKSEEDVMLEVEVNPADVVAVPVDYNNAKMRTCKYTVLGVIDKEHSSDLSLRKTSTADADTSSSCGGCQDCEEKSCQDDEEDEVAICNQCGGPNDIGFDLCLDCEDESKKDEYPWDDEFS